MWTFHLKVESMSDESLISLKINEITSILILLITRLVLLVKKMSLTFLPLVFDQYVYVQFL